MLERVSFPSVFILCLIFPSVGKNDIDIHEVGPSSHAAVCLLRCAYLSRSSCIRHFIDSGDDPILFCWLVS